MIKMRLTFVNDKDGRKECDEVLKGIVKMYKVVNVSKYYKGRGSSKYSNLYIDLELLNKM
ncbi:hypothetical protein [Clostridium perfringens]|uniref:hypothetical protein n=1 Tax=Clostridium perfringens TaxID=1502 RepID=UPI0022478AF7|nr:hypothetical protein [Clostridium perfringens]MCX0413105.1 hypothetical protein [Clostridium perfringens]MDK0690128.1 hypothetical protein [Clostridium perfringens]